MGNFVSKEPIKVVVEGQPDEWVMIKPKMSVGDRGTLNDRIMTVNASKGTADVDVKAGQMLQAMLEINVIDWRLLDDDGQPVLFKKDMIAGLDPDAPLIDAVLGEIAKRNPTLSGATATLG